MVIFDRYHVVAVRHEAVDAVRRAEAKTRMELKSTRYVLLLPRTCVLINNLWAEKDSSAIVARQDIPIPRGWPLLDGVSYAAAA
ncbi:MAG: transposase [Acidimicrobiales bacterium]